MKRRRWIILIAVIVVVGLGVYFGMLRSTPKAADDISTLGVAQRPMPIPRGSISRSIEASGTMSGARQAELGFATSGQVQRILVETGQFVEAGSVLAEMENSQQELAVLRARNAVDLAVISGTTNSRREAELELKVAEENLAQTTIRAPFSGVVTAIGVEEGEQVSASTVVISLLDNSVFYADISVDELDMSQISLGQAAVVEVDAIGDTPLYGTVSEIGMIAQSSGGITTVPVSVRIDDAPAGLRVGYSASVTIEVERVDDVLKLPVEAVVRSGNQSFVTVVRDGQEIPVEVVTGMTDGVEVEIVSGLEPTDQVIGFNFMLYGNTEVLQRNSSSRMPSIRVGGFGR